MIGRAVLLIESILHAQREGYIVDYKTWYFDAGKTSDAHAELAAMGYLVKVLGTERGFAWSLTEAGHAWMLSMAENARE